MRQSALILVHAGVYKNEFLVVDSNVAILGAGERRGGGWRRGRGGVTWEGWGDVGGVR